MNSCMVLLRLDYMEHFVMHSAVESYYRKNAFQVEITRNLFLIEMELTTLRIYRIGRRILMQNK